MASDNSDIIGTIKVNGSIADIRYIGGSTFEIDFRDARPDEEPMRARKDVIDKWIRRGKMRLTNAARYRQIESEIDPATGDTPTHHADGTEKTLVERELSNLQRQGFVSGQDDDATGDATPAGADAQDHAHDDGAATDAGTTVRPMVPITQTQQTPIAGMQDGDAPKAIPLDDDSGRPKTLPARTKSPQVFAYVLVMLAIAVVALFGGRLLASKIRDGSAMGVVHGIVSNADTGSNVQNATNGNDADAGSGNGSANASNDASSGQGHVVRTDFDPETSVQSQPSAGDAGRDTATQMFEYIRQLFAAGDAQDLSQAVNLDGIATQIANAYASVAKGQQGLTDTETSTLAAYYKQAFEDEELDNASKNDIYGSIFGGRIRDVRVDSQDANKLYVVMESLGGDHQRVCFILQSSDNGSSWIISGIMDADGYVRQIMRGDTSQYEKRSD